MEKDSRSDWQEFSPRFDPRRPQKFAERTLRIVQLACEHRGPRRRARLEQRRRG